MNLHQNFKMLKQEVLRIPQSSSIAGTSPSGCLVLYPEHSFVGSYLSVDVQPTWAMMKVHSSRNILTSIFLRNKFITFGLLCFSIFSILSDYFLLFTSAYIYIYIYICVCVCVCVYVSL